MTSLRLLIESENVLGRARAQTLGSRNPDPDHVELLGTCPCMCTENKRSYVVGISQLSMLLFCCVPGRTLTADKGKSGQGLGYE